MPKVPNPTSVELALPAVPKRSNEAWSAEDDETLIKSRTQGLNWNQIAPRHFPSKSPNACRKRHERLMERQNAEQWDGVKLDILSQAYMDVRREMWSIMSDRVGEKWQTLEQKCMEKGLKNLNQACRNTQKKRGTYCSHDDSGVGISDLDEDDRSTDILHTNEDFSFPQFPFASQRPRVPSIQSILQPPTPFSNQSQRAISNLNNLGSYNAPLAIHSNELSGANIQSPTQPVMDSDYQTPHVNPQIEDDACESSSVTDSAVDTSSVDDASSRNSSSHQDRDSTTPGDSETSENLESFDSTAFELQREMMLDRLMIYVNGILNEGSSHRQHRGDSSSSRNYSHQQASDAPFNKGKAKRKSSDRGDDQEDDNSPDKGSKKPREDNSYARPSVKDNRRLACHYYKHNPQKYKNTRSCAGPDGWNCIARLKEHLYRRHTLQPQCVRCCQTFQDEARLTEHSRAQEGCFVRELEPLEGLDKHQVEQLKHRKNMFRAGSEEEKWRIIYLILFPDTDPNTVPSPYYGQDNLFAELPGNGSPKDLELAQYDAFMSRELPRKIRKELEIAIEKTTGPIEETLKTQIEVLIRNCQMRLSQEYLKRTLCAVKQPLRDTTEAGTSGEQNKTPEPSINSPPLTSGGNDTVAQCNMPLDDLLDPWQFLWTPPNSDYTTFSDSAYFPDISVAIPSDPGWKLIPDVLNTISNANPSEYSCMIEDAERLQRNSDYSVLPPHTGKGKGRADQDVVK